MDRPLPIDAGYTHAEVYAELVLRVRELAPPGLCEAWGVCQFRGHDDYRLKLGRYRVIGLAPLATRLTVWMDWRRLFAIAEEGTSGPGGIAAGDDDIMDADIRAFIAAFPNLSIRNTGQPWNVRSMEEVYSEAGRDLLRSGMRLMVRQLARRHPDVPSVDPTYPLSSLVQAARQPECW